MKCNILYKGDGEQLTIFACYSWEMTLNFGIAASWDNSRTGMEHGRKQVELTVRKLIYNE
jgi:hypothetical protein